MCNAGILNLCIYPIDLIEYVNVITLLVIEMFCSRISTCQNKPVNTNNDKYII